MLQITSRYVQSQGQAVYSPAAIALAYQIVNGTCPLSNGCVDDPQVMYDADFSGEAPYFINIHSNAKGQGLGQIAFLHFLSQVGQGKEFVSTDFTSSGQHLFESMISQGMIRQVQEASGWQRTSWWQVTGNPQIALQQIASQQQ